MSLFLSYFVLLLEHVFIFYPKIESLVKTGTGYNYWRSYDVIARGSKKTDVWIFREMANV